MAKVVTMRERVHQPFYDTLIRTSGYAQGQVQDNTNLFVVNNTQRNEATTNLPSGNTLPSDQSHVTLALRVFAWFRNPILRVPGGASGEVAENGDYSTVTPWLTDGVGFGNAPGSIQDYYRLIWQTEEQLHWTFGTGMKNSIDNMPTWYFPAGGGISGSMAGATDLIHWQNNGYDGHTGILRLARAILLPPRQNVICQAKIIALPGENSSSTFGTTTAIGRNMLSLRDNLNAVDGVSKVIQFMFDGLFSRDVQ